MVDPKFANPAAQHSVVTKITNGNSNESCGDLRMCPLVSQPPQPMRNDFYAVRIDVAKNLIHHRIVTYRLHAVNCFSR